MKEPTNSSRFAKESRKRGKRISGQDKPNFRGTGISEIEGKGAMGSAEQGGSRASFNRGNGISEIEGKGAMGSAEQGGSRASFNWILFNSVDSVCSVIFASSVVKNNLAA